MCVSLKSYAERMCAATPSFSKVSQSLQTKAGSAGFSKVFFPRDENTEYVNERRNRSKSYAFLNENELV